MLHFSHAHIQQMVEHAEACLPEEACGLVGGVDGVARLVVPVTNSLHSPVRFCMDPHEQLAAFLRFDDAGLELMAIYHSHPGGPEMPSFTDLTEWNYPGTHYLILSPDADDQRWQVNAFLMEGGEIKRVIITIH